MTEREDITERLEKVAVKYRKLSAKLIKATLIRNKIRTELTIHDGENFDGQNTASERAPREDIVERLAKAIAKRDKLIAKRNKADVDWCRIKKERSPYDEAHKPREEIVQRTEKAGVEWEASHEAWSKAHDELRAYDEAHKSREDIVEKRDKAEKEWDLKESQWDTANEAKRAAATAWRAACENFFKVKRELKAHDKAATREPEPESESRYIVEVHRAGLMNIFICLCGDRKDIHEALRYEYPGAEFIFNLAIFRRIPSLFKGE